MLLRHLMTSTRRTFLRRSPAYYQGDASVASHGVYDDTRRYQREVQALIDQDV